VPTSASASVRSATQATRAVTTTPELRRAVPRPDHPRPAAVDVSAFNTNAEAKVQFIQFNSKFFAIGARYVHVFNEATGQWDVDKDMGATAAAVKGARTVYGDYMVVAAGAAVNYWRLSTRRRVGPALRDEQPDPLRARRQHALDDLRLEQLSSSTNFVTWTTAVGDRESRSRRDARDRLQRQPARR
jgi:hypothetical protein